MRADIEHRHSGSQECFHEARFGPFKAAIQDGLPTNIVSHQPPSAERQSHRTKGGREHSNPTETDGTPLFAPRLAEESPGAQERTFGPGPCSGPRIIDDMRFRC